MHAGGDERSKDFSSLNPCMQLFYLLNAYVECLKRVIWISQPCLAAGMWLGEDVCGVGSKRP
jgi:hypothetical protein